MKNTLLVFGLIVWALCSNAQIIQFSDPKFKLVLLSIDCVDIDNDGFGDKKVDTNNNGEIEVEEALSVTSLAFTLLIDSIPDILHFENLERLKIPGLVTLDKINLDKLNFLYLYNCSFNKLNINSFPNLKELNYHSSSNLSTLNLSTHQNIKTLNMSEMVLDTLNILGNFSLNKLELYSKINNVINDEHNSLDSIILSNENESFSNINLNSFKKLKYLYLEAKRSNLNLNNLNFLEYLNLNFLITDTINLSNLPKLEILVQNNEALKVMNLNLDNLSILSISNSSLKKLNLTYLPNLDSLNLSGNAYLKNISLINNFKIRSIIIYSSSQFDSLILENLELLENITIQLSKLKYYKINNLPNLKYLALASDMISHINLRNLPNLTNLHLISISINTVELDSLKSLQSLILASSTKYLKINNGVSPLFKLELGSHHGLTNVSLKNIDSLATLSLVNNSILKNLTLENIIFLDKFILDNTKIKDSLYITNVDKINEVEILNNLTLEYLPTALLYNTKKLKILQNKEINEFSVSNNNILEQCEVSQQLIKFRLTNCNFLKKLNISLGTLTTDSIVIENLSNLQELTLKLTNQNGILNLYQFNKLKFLNLLYINLTELSLSNFPQLESLNLDNITISNLSIVNLDKLESIRINKLQQLNKLQIDNLSTLKYITLSDNPLIDSIKLYNLNNLDSIYILNQNISNIKSIDLKNLQAIRVLRIEGFENVTELNLSELISLKELRLYQNELLYQLDLSNLQNLSYVILSDLNKLNEINISDLDSVKVIQIDNNKNIKSIKIENLSALHSFISNENESLNSITLKNLNLLSEYFYSYDKYLDSLILDNLPLIYLSVENTELTYLNLKNVQNLSEIRCGSNKIQEFIYDTLPALEYLDLSFNELREVEIHELRALKYFDCNNNKIKNLNIPKFHNHYSTFNCGANEISILDIQDCKKLDNFYCFENPFLTHLYIRGTRFLNNQADPNRYFIYGNSNLKFICCDDDLINGWKYIAENLGYDVDLLEFNTNCEYSPSGVFYTVKGNIKYDINNNGCDTNDRKFNALKLILQNEFVQLEILPNSSGNYFIPLPASNNLIKVKLNLPELFIVTPDSINFTFPGLSDTMVQDFCVTPSKIENLLNLSIIPLTAARPGFDAKYSISITNNGNQVAQGTVHFTYDESILDFVSAEITPSVQNDGILSWNFTDLLEGQTINYDFVLNLNSPAETPSLNNGDELKLTCNVLSNVFTLNQVVVGSFDPNDKTCLEGNFLKPDMIGQYIHYLIRFENTGSYPAENIRVLDILDTNVFEVSSLIIVESSHEMYAKIKGTIVEFIFDNILLPFDDTSNDGYVCFKIKTKPTLVLGDELKNKANIYFDYNVPIETNETNTIVALPVGTDEAIRERNIEIYPNPVSEVLKFSGDDKILKVKIFDMSGRLVQESNVMDSEVNVERLLPGVYQISIKTINGMVNKTFSKL